MPPVPVHINDPITPSKTNATSASGLPADNSATTTQAQQHSPYPAARPGAPAAPAPTPYIPQPQALPQPTRTTPATDYGPPAPQPGAVPVPPSQQAPMTATATSTLPPPPKAGEVTTMPPQMAIPSPQVNHASTYSTTAAGPTTLNFGAAAAPQQIQAGSGPPGYQQNVHAQELTPAARASLEQEQSRPSMATNLGLSDSTNETAGNVWNTVKGWASSAGTTLAETEKEVWKRINRDS
ncbi:unnamed protein product [Zymoseptoria tritici ST99CH_3D1]|uniref:Uncharacterized protein n=1 Tax=Zymoseptoria tritici (strain ST99CH_3D7) TaxID=1276538 RepID=A0A1X7REF9_ZYMT9|nr:unnamed protein product [Zymoseptoria tritici ST99CH_3D7]SMR44338.1 unnamed protein product [Zymoseptoria tritici ST99CH_3D1]